MSIKENTTGIITRLTIAGSLLLVICYAIQCVETCPLYKPLAYGSLSLAYIIVTVFTGRKYLHHYFFAAGLVYLFVIRFDNYTPFTLVLIACYMRPSCLPFYIGGYIAGTIYQFWNYDDDFTHVFIHYITCAFMFLGLEALREKERKREPLALTPAEEDILQQIADGAEIKAITGYSENTIYKKLREARERNELINNTELIARYKKQL